MFINYFQLNGKSWEAIANEMGSMQFPGQAGGVIQFIHVYSSEQTGKNVTVELKHVLLICAKNNVICLALSILSYTLDSAV